MSALTERADFGIIRYSNCWEDADILLEALQIKPHSSILSIGSAGDNSFSMLSSNPELVIAIDLSVIQLHLIELKKAAIKAMEREEYLSFIGVNPSEKRVANFELIKNDLPADARKFWESNLSYLEEGLIYAGKFERYFKFFRKWLLPLIHSEKSKHKLFESKNSNEQKEFYDKIWNNKRWQFMFLMFFNKTAMGKYGRDPEFLNEVKVPVHRYIFHKAEDHLQSVACQQNYFLRMIILGSFGDTLPHYLRAENYGIIKSNISRLRTMKGYAQEALKNNPQVSYCNLSNIFEYMPTPIFKETATELANFTPEGCKMAYWNLMVPRRLTRILPEKYNYDQTLSNKLSELDKGFFYNGIHIDSRK